MSWMGSQEYITHCLPPVLRSGNTVYVWFLTDIYPCFTMTEILEVPQLPQTLYFSAKVYLRFFHTNLIYFSAI